MEALDAFRQRLSESLAGDTFVRLTLSSPAERGDAVPERVIGRRVELARGSVVSFTVRFARRDVTENVPLGEVPDWVSGRVPSQFRSALLATTTRDWQLHVDGAGRARLVRHKPATRVLPSTAHDRRKRSLLDESATPWLAALSIVDSGGRVKPSRSDKYAQIDRYVEILSHLVRDCDSFDGVSPMVADMGSGKGYLTFGAWHLFRRVLGLDARVLGVEARAELAAAAEAVARAVEAEGLSFVGGEIGAVPIERLDVLIALHACDTATDDAIVRGIDAGARLIVVAPCCHREVRPAMGEAGALARVLRHGLMKEHLAEWATDALRALHLEWAGYETRVIEFVGSEHTPKNRLIAGIRRRPAFASSEARERIDELKRMLAIEHQALDPLLARGAVEPERG